MAAICKQLFYCLLAISIQVLDAQEPNLKKLDADPCVRVTDSVQEFSSTIWLIHENYENCTVPNEIQTLRVHTQLLSNDTEDSDPVVFVTRSNSEVQTWQLPYKDDRSKQVYTSTKHTICRRPDGIHQEDDDTTTAVYPVMLYMDVFTSSVSEAVYSLEFEPVELFTLSLSDKNTTFNLSFNEPQLYYFKFPNDSDTVRVIANANIDKEDDSKCAIVSVQNASCPVNDQLDNARSKGMWQTMTSSASLVVTANKMVKGREFFIVVVAASHDVCEDRSESNKKTNSNKTHDYEPYKITLSVEILHSAKSFTFAIILPLIIFFPLGIVIVLFFYFSCFECTFVPFMCKECVEVKCSHCLNEKKGEYSPIEESYDESVDESTQVRVTNKSYGAANVPNFAANIQGRPDSSLFATGTFRGLLMEKETDLRLTDMTSRGYTDLERSYKVYGWNTITIGIFYALPAFQLVFSEQMVLNDNGDQDLCYYNFKCSHPFGALSSFNNVWSNVGYFIMGLTFLAIVAIRNYRANEERRRNKNKFDNFGVPQFFGVYYAMGFALVMEAFMSSFYHICPSDNNFQFDTAFMFIIGGLLIVKMLQARHPDIHANAFIAFFCFAVVTFLTFIGIWEWSKPYWETKFTLAILALIGLVGVTISYYYFHDWRIGHALERRTYKDLMNWLKTWCVLCNSKEKAKKYLPKHPYRFVKTTLLIVVNIGLGVLMALSGSGIATVVLSLFVANFILLLLLYIICKLWYREPLTLMPVVFLVLLSVCWVTSFYFYFNNVAQWEFSPANSRTLNKECLVLKFYDNHDVWHFLSAAAMFFSFLFLFTLDDGTKRVEREKLHVF